MKTEFQKIFESQQEGLNQWTDFLKNVFAAPPKQEGYQVWPAFWFKYWSNPWLAFSGVEKPFSPEALQKSMLSFFKTYPGWMGAHLFTDYNKWLEKYIAFLEDLDLPFDEIAEFWGKMLDVYPLKENPVFSSLGESTSKYIRIMINPLYEVVETPEIVPYLKHWYALQFHFLSSMIRNIELRSMVLEISLAAWPETMKVFYDRLEKTGDALSPADFYQEFLNELENDLHRLMESDDYISVQNKTVEAMLDFKAHLGKWFELVLANLPFVTTSDFDDMSHEMEALRRKMRKMEKAKNGIAITT